MSNIKTILLEFTPKATTLEIELEINKKLSELFNVGTIANYTLYEIEDREIIDHIHILAAQGEDDL
jgi:hypothetical protein